MLTLSTLSPNREDKMRQVLFHDTRDELGRALLEELKPWLEKSSRESACYDLNAEEIAPCWGCFSCWIKTPGQCIHRDKGELYLKEQIRSDRVLLLSPLTWGGFSAAAKVVLDRSIGTLLPFFERRKGETHHPPRYERRSELISLGYGENLTEREKDLFRKNSRNINDNIKREPEEGPCFILESTRDLDSLKKRLGGLS